MKVLILSCNTGQGHNSAANALLERFSDAGAECVLRDSLAYVSKLYSNSVSISYNKIVLHTPRAFGVGYRFSKAMKSRYIKSYAYAANMMCSNKIYEEIINEKFDAVVCTHVFPGQALTHVKHKYGIDIPLYMVATDYSFAPFYNEIDAENFFICMQEILSEFTTRGIYADKIIASGIPVAKKFNIDISKEQARKELGLSNDNKICLIMSGSMGYGNIYDLIDKILKEVPDKTKIIVVAGKNIKLKKGIEEKYDKDFRVFCIGYTDKVNLYMKASDVVVTKPGGLSSTEAMVSNVPLVLTKPIPGCETENFRLITKLGCALAGTKPKEASLAVKSILGDNRISERIIAMQSKYINKNSAEIIASTVLNKKPEDSELDLKI